MVNKFLTFLKGIYSTGTSESSKRFFGSIGFICAIFFIAFWKHDLIETLLYISAVLIGLETVATIAKAVKTPKND